jgi:hypothetical protein
MSVSITELQCKYFIFVRPCCRYYIGSTSNVRRHLLSTPCPGTGCVEIVTFAGPGRSITIQDTFAHAFVESCLDMVSRFDASHVSVGCSMKRTNVRRWPIIACLSGQRVSWVLDSIVRSSINYRVANSQSSGRLARPSPCRGPQRTTSTTLQLKRAPTITKPAHLILFVRADMATCCFYFHHTTSSYSKTISPIFTKYFLKKKK